MSGKVAVQTQSERRRRARRGFRGGTAALEFALVSGAFVALVLGVMNITYIFYVQEMLDFATQAAARQIQIGAAQSQANPTSFIQQTMCTALAGLLPCASIMISSQVVTDFYTLNAGQVPTSNGSFNTGSLSACTGQPGQLVLLQTFYPATGILTSYLPVQTVLVNGKPANVIVSTAGFMNEQFTSIGTPPGC